jgi:hypothetical protein
LHGRGADHLAPDSFADPHRNHHPFRRPDRVRLPAGHFHAGAAHRPELYRYTDLNGLPPADPDSDSDADGDESTDESSPAYESSPTNRHANSASADRYAKRNATVIMHQNRCPPKHNHP